MQLIHLLWISWVRYYDLDTARIPARILQHSLNLKEQVWTPKQVKIEESPHERNRNLSCSCPRYGLDVKVFALKCTFVGRHMTQARIAVNHESFLLKKM